MKKLFISAILFTLMTVLTFGQNTLENWQGDFYWDAPTGPTPTGYNFYKSLVSGGPYTKVNSNLISGLTFNDPTAVEGQYFVVSAVSSIGMEGLSNEIRVEDQEGPTQFRFVFEGTGTLTVTTP